MNIYDPRQTVALSGASGMLGGSISDAMESSGRRVVKLTRGEPKEAGELHWNPYAPIVVEDLYQLENLSAAIHLSGASVAGHRWTDAYKREIRTSRVDSTRNLASTLASLRTPPSVLIVASAIGIYGDRGDQVLDESSQPGAGFMADLCQEWEAAAQPAVDAGIRVVHTRFGVVLGPKGGALSQMLPLFRLGLGGRLGSGRQWMSWVSLKDVVSGILFALDNATLHGPINFTAPQPVTNAELTRALGRAVHRPAIIPAPAFALRLALGQMADEALLASARVMPTRLIGAGFHFTHPTIDEALAFAVGSGS